MVANEFLQRRLEQMLRAESGASVRALENSVTPPTAFRRFSQTNKNNTHTLNRTKKKAVISKPYQFLRFILQIKPTLLQNAVFWDCSSRISCWFPPTLSVSIVLFFCWASISMEILNPNCENNIDHFHFRPHFNQTGNIW